MMTCAAAITVSALLTTALPIESQQAPTPVKPSEQAAPADHKSEREALAARVGKAHRKPDSPKVDRFDAGLTLTMRGKDKGSVDVQLSVRYGKRIERAKDKFAEMIRYSIDEGDKPVERGLDPRPWERIGDRVKDLGAKADRETKRLLARDTRLCRQLLQFLDPGAILRGLRGDGPVETVKLRVGRGPKGMVEAEHIAGRLASFPIFRSRGEGARAEAVQMEAWVEKASSRLLAVRIYPLEDSGKPEKNHGEFIVLKDYVSSKGVLIPRELLIYADSGAQKEQRAKVHISAFRLNPDFTLRDFARPR